MGRHSKGRHTTGQHRTFQTVDTTGTAHVLTADTAADGYSGGRYTTIYAEEILPAALVAREARFCPLCPVPAQRHR